MIEYYEFWSKAFDLPVAEFVIKASARTHSGRYLDQYGSEYIFHFTDLTTSKEVMAVPDECAEQLREINSLDRLKAAGFDLAFADLDFGLKHKNDFRIFQSLRSDIKIDQLTDNDDAVKDFLAACTEEDRDTLDLTFTDETVCALKVGDTIKGMARAARTRSNPKLADITVVVAPGERGKGYSLPLVSALVEILLREGLTPKYRVGESNLPSQAIARRLGLKPLFKVSTWKGGDFLKPRRASADF